MNISEENNLDAALLLWRRIIIKRYNLDLADYCELVVRHEGWR